MRKDSSICILCIGFFLLFSKLVMNILLFFAQNIVTENVIMTRFHLDIHRDFTKI